MNKKSKATLERRLRAARRVLRRHYTSVYDRERIRGNKILAAFKPEVAKELVRIDDAIDAVTDAINGLRVWDTSNDGGLTQCDMHEDESR